MNLFTELRSCLDIHFKGLMLVQPLSFKEAPGLRFDLQDAALETGEDAYFDEVVRRMDRIHSLTTSDADTVMILYQKYTYKRRKIRFTNYLFKQIDKSSASIQFKRNKKPATDVDGDFTKPYDRSCQVLIKDIARHINFHNLYIATSRICNPSLKPDRLEDEKL
jgi:hypothetical protein